MTPGVGIWAPWSSALGWRACTHCMACATGLACPRLFWRLARSWEAPGTGTATQALVIAGPGLTNAMTGIANAHVARAPVLQADPSAIEQAVELVWPACRTCRLWMPGIRPSVSERRVLH
jgi:hypothetical protein